MLMTMRWVLLATVLVLAACNRGAAPTGTAEGACVRQPAGMAATPSASFRDFLATRPTPAAFRAHYPDMTLVMPGDIVTREFRFDCTRFFADLDNEGHVVGGRFG
jgi:hypothetical protein